MDAEAHWLELPRYIHRNPIDIIKGKPLESYKWSSYPAYIGQIQTPEWLTTQYILNAIGQRNQRKRYQSFVESGISDELVEFYGGSGVCSILGDSEFKSDYIRRIEQDSKFTLAKIAEKFNLAG